MSSMMPGLHTTGTTATGDAQALGPCEQDKQVHRESKAAEQGQDWQDSEPPCAEHTGRKKELQPWWTTGRRSYSAENSRGLRPSVSRSQHSLT